MIQFLSSAPWALPVSIFRFCIWSPLKFISMDSPPLGYTLVCKKHIYIQKMTLSSLLTWIPSFCMKFVKFLYKSCFVMNLIPIWPQSHKLLFLRLADFCKKMLMSVKFSAITSNFYKFSETTSHCEIAYQIWRVHHFLFKYKNAKKRFSIPHEFDRKTVNLAKKKTTQDFLYFLNQNDDPICRIYWLKLKKCFRRWS